MNKKNLLKFIIPGILLSFLSVTVFAQPNKTNPPLLKRTKYQTETVEFGAGGTLSVVGPPEGSIEIEGWQKNEIEIAAEIEVQGYTEEDLKMLAEVTGFIIDEGLTQVSIISVGTHDHKYLKKAFKKFPKELQKMPFRVNYKIKVPHFISLEVTGGKGDFKLSMVEGMMRINYLESNASLNLIGGAVQVTIGSGNVDVTIGARSWRGQFADVQIATGNLNLWLPKNMNANLTAKVLQTGKIDNSYKLLKPMRLTRFTEKGMYAKVGNGGAELSFTVGDGMLKIADFETIAKN
jgi:hypothetical protein